MCMKLGKRKYEIRSEVHADQCSGCYFDTSYNLSY